MDSAFSSLVEDVFHLITEKLSLADLFSLSRVSMRLRRWIQKEERYQRLINYQVRYRRDYQGTVERACLAGEVEIASLLYQRRNKDWKANLRKNDDLLFWRVCERGLVEIARWMLSVNPRTNFTFGSSNVFRIACEGGHLELAQFLKQAPMIHRPFALWMEVDYLVKICMGKEHLNILHWFHEEQVLRDIHYRYMRRTTTSHLLSAWLHEVRPLPTST